MLQWSSFLMICSSRFWKQKKNDQFKKKTKKTWRGTINIKEIAEVKFWKSVKHFYSKTWVVLQAYLEPLVLQHLFNCHHLLAVNKASLVHHTKRPITDHLQGISKVTSNVKSSEYFFFIGTSTKTFEKHFFKIWFCLITQSVQLYK